VRGWRREAVGKSTRAVTLSTVISVLVTEIQPPRVCAVNDSFVVEEKPFLPKDLGRLDCCDKHRNEGGRERRGRQRQFGCLE